MPGEQLNLVFPRIFTLNISIEVALPKDASTTEKGTVLEKFATRLLETQNFRVVQQVRLTAMEVDLLAQEKSTGERVFVECKAYRSTISADVLTKLLGNVVADDDLTAGWLISTYALGKDAKGFRDKWNQKPLPDRRRLQIYDPEALLGRLVGAGLVVDPATLVVPSELRLSDERFLLLTDFGEFWAVVVFDPDSGIRESALLYDARTGGRITAKGIAARITETDTSLAALSWLIDESSPSQIDRDQIRIEYQSVVQVPVADDWADYRPARPADFVGRDEHLRSVFDFFENIRTRTSRTRILAIKAPSGWGKSSFVLKIANSAQNIRNRKKCFVYAVDSRAANSRRFGELALALAITAAQKEGFIAVSSPLGFGGTTNPFADHTMKAVLEELQRDGKVLCLVFDQFEELLYKAELESVFDEIRALCNSVDEAQENIVIGFSWKTDGTIPTEHKAYYLWQNLADRRKEIELEPFSAREVSSALTKFAKEMGQPLAPQLKRLLEDHCQGYPWLLKKLCIHIMDLVRGGLDQNDILVRSLSIQELFKKDIERMAPDEFACTKEIAMTAPADFFRVVETYGVLVVNQLLDKRLIIRSGTRLSIYWDIFKDYLLTERVPYIPVTYVPQTPFSAFANGFRLLLRSKSTTYDLLAQELGLSKATAENVVRDLVMIGNAEANRKLEVVKLDSDSEEEASRQIISFCMSHVVYRELLKEKGDGGSFTSEEVLSIAKRSLRLPSASDSLAEEYKRRLQRWFLAVGLIGEGGATFKLQSRISHIGILNASRLSTRRISRDNFLGEAPPHSVLKSLAGIVSAPNTRVGLESSYGRNNISALISLGVLSAVGNLTIEVQDPHQIENILRAKAASQATIQHVNKIRKENPDINTRDIGYSVALEFGYQTWAEASMKRYGSALNIWSRWSSGETVRTRRQHVTIQN